MGGWVGADVGTGGGPERRRGGTVSTIPPPPPPHTHAQVASGTGQHAAHCSPSLPTLRWQPTEADPTMLPSIAAWTRGLPSVLPPLPLDAAAPPEVWGVPLGSCAAALVVNMCHISPWAATLGMLAGTARALRPGGLLFIYGPFR